LICYKWTGALWPRNTSNGHADKGLTHKYHNEIMKKHET